MAPIRIGFIGLSASGGWAVPTHWAYLSQSSKYQIVALCNSSVEAAKKAIEHYKLPATTKAYASPSDLAQDPNVDLVVCCVRVDRHYDSIKPALLAGKPVFTEWPLTISLSQAEELASLAKEKGVKTAIGFQGRQDLLVRKIKEIIASGKIGRVLSSTMTGQITYYGGTETEQTAYLADIKYGGLLVTVMTGHCIDWIQYTLGELTTFTALLANQRPTFNLVSADGSILSTHPKTSHDQVILTGTLSSGAVLSYHLRGGGPFPGTPAHEWRIYGEKGEIRVTAGSFFLHMEPSDRKMEVWVSGAEKPDVVDVEGDGWTKLPNVARNVAREYEAFADGGGHLADFEEAVRRQKLTELIYQSSETGMRVKYTE
ncbi:MAG: transcription regulator gal80 [Cirrosporium novae-zelandiae]|nr:MAG: transcription regulator gal80 [Cirrosporium novae-zelandiae]